MSNAVRPSAVHQPVRQWAWPVGFLLSIAVVAGAAAVILWGDLREGDRNSVLVGQALERGMLLSRLRLGASALESAVEAFVHANTASQRAEAEKVISKVLANLGAMRQGYLRLHSGDDAESAKLWERFEKTSLALAAEVEQVTGDGDRGELARERLQAVEDLQPLFAELDSIGAALASANARSATSLQLHLEQRRRRLLTGGGTVLAAAVVLALLVGVAMGRRMREQARTIARQLDELDARNRELDAFAGRVAHDLVGPLSPLQGHITLARRSASVRSDAKVAEHLERARESVDRMAGLVESLLRFCRAGTRGDPAAASLDQVVTSQLMDVAQTAAAKQVALERHLTPSVVVDCPSTLLHCIAQNLLSNAVKYSAGTPSATVRVQVRSEGSELGHPGHGVLEVADNGPGISPVAQAKLFRPFFRAPEVKELPGYGLGLATTKRLVEAHGGTLHLRSGPGEGTTVVARLPLAKVGAVGRPLGGHERGEQEREEERQAVWADG